VGLVAIAGELDRYPLFLEVILNMIKYFIHLSNTICTGLVAEAFEVLRKLHLENKRSWYWLYVPQFRYGLKTN
jgi:hypothetical protein